MFSIAILLFLIMDPFGNIIVVNSLLANLPLRQQLLILFREAAFALALMLAAAWFGGTALEALGLREYSLRLAGGIVLFLIAMGMLFPSRKFIDEPVSGTPFIVPIAMPLIAGPSVISMVILFSQRHSSTLVSGAILFATLGSTVLLASSFLFYKYLGRRGAAALERLMGMLLIIVSVQMILDGIDVFLKSRI